LFTGSLVEIEYTFNCSPFEASNVSPYLKSLGIACSPTYWGVDSSITRRVLFRLLSKLCHVS